MGRLKGAVIGLMSMKAGAKIIDSHRSCSESKQTRPTKRGRSLLSGATTKHSMPYPSTAEGHLTRDEMHAPGALVFCFCALACAMTAS